MLDQHGLEDLAKKFAPTYIPSEGEECYLAEIRNGAKPKILRAYPPGRPCIYYHVELLRRSDKDAYVINYFSLWDRDTGGSFLGLIPGLFGRHKWDVERTAILATGPKESNNVNDFEAKRAYFAAHEGKPFSGGGYLDQLPDPHKGLHVYWSLGKHASYSEPNIPWWFSIGEQFYQPDDEDIARPPNYALKNASSEEWFSYTGMWDGIESVSYKLKYREVFHFDDAKGWINLQEGTATEENVKAFQRAIGHKETGLIDLEAYMRSKMLSPDLIRNADKIDDHLLEELVELQGIQINEAPPLAIQDKIKAFTTKNVADIEDMEEYPLGYLSPDHQIIGLMSLSEGKIIDYRIRSGKLFDDRYID